jgi:hypothetical protein
MGIYVKTGQGDCLISWQILSTKTVFKCYWLFILNFLMAIFIGQILYHDTENLTEQVKKRRRAI